MKQFLFKQSVLLGKGKAGLNSVGTTYHLGVHEVSEAHQKDATFLFYQKHGLIVPFTKKEKTELKPATSAAAKQSAEVAKSQVDSTPEVLPDVEIGGSSEESAPPESPVEPDPGEASNARSARNARNGGRR